MATTRRIADFRHLDQFESLFPFSSSFARTAGSGGRLDPGVGLVSPDRGSPDRGQVDRPNSARRLTRAEEIARPALRQVAFRNLETVRRLGHRFQPLARFVGQQRLIQEEAMRLIDIAPTRPRN
jgi:hypothetical protein